MDVFLTIKPSLTPNTVDPLYPDTPPSQETTANEEDTTKKLAQQLTSLAISPKSITQSLHTQNMETNVYANKILHETYSTAPPPSPTIQPTSLYIPAITGTNNPMCLPILTIHWQM